MSLIHGEPITPEQVERVISREFTADKFAALCNTIAWATAGGRCPRLPSFTGRVMAKDKGVDAEWDFDLPDGDYASPLVAPGWNVFQYKQRDIFAQGRRKTFSDLKSGMKGALKQLHAATSRRPDRYVVFTNLDLTHKTDGDKGELEQSILEGVGSRTKARVEIVGAAELAALLNGLPYVRSAYFANSLFTTWDDSWKAHARHKTFSPQIELVGRKDELNELRESVDDPGVRAILVAGPPDMGKTRISLDGLSHRAAETVVATDAPSLKASDLLALEAPGRESLVLIEDPEPERAEAFIHQALAHDGLKVVITLPTVEKVPLPNFGQDERVKTIPLTPLSATQSQKLLEAAGATFDYSMESWVIDQSGGNPGVLLFAASLGDHLRNTTATFSANVASAFEKKLNKDYGADAVRRLELLSLLTQVGVRGAAGEEVEKILKLLGDGMTLGTLLKGLSALETAGVVRSVGLYVEVTPPLLADRLAQSALSGRFTELCLLFASLNRSARLRLVQRLSMLRAEEVDRFWESAFGPQGLFKDLPTALENVQFLQLIAGTVPERVARVVEEGLESMTQERRGQIDRHQLRGLLSALEELLFREGTSAAAMRCLALLAETGTAINANPAAVTLIGCFIPAHSQLPLSLNERLEMLRSFIAADNSTQLRLVAVGALKQALSQVPAIFLRRGSGAVPFDPQTPVTWGEAWDYIEESLDLLIAATKSDDQAVSGAALHHLPEVVAESALLLPTRPEAVVARCRSLVGDLVSNGSPLAVPDLLRSLRSVRAVFGQQKKGRGNPMRGRFQAAIKEIDALIGLIDKGEYSLKVKRWAGQETPDHYGEIGKAGRERFDRELQTLAAAAAKTPALLTSDLLAWLCSREARYAHRFFYWLGNYDRKRVWLPTMEALGMMEEGLGALGRYYGGMGNIDPAFVNDQLDRLAGDPQINGQAIILATSFLAGDIRGVIRAERLIRDNRVDSAFVEQMLRGGGWIKPLGPDEYLRLLRAIAGAQLENAVVVLHFLTMWVHYDRAISGELGEFAAAVLEAALPLSSANAWSFDVVASILAQSDPERGFGLLEKLLTQPYGVESWSPLRRDGRVSLWQVLRKADRERAVRTVLSVALRGAAYRYQITHDMRTVIDKKNAGQGISQEADADVLIAFALEGEAQAELVSQCITAAMPNFWGIALKIVEQHPRNKNVLAALSLGAEKVGKVTKGPWSKHLERCRRDVEARLEDDTTPVSARPWLRQLQTSLRKRALDSQVSEAEEQVKGWDKVTEDAMAPERLWVIKILLQAGKLTDLRRVLSKREILQMIPELQLSDAESSDLRTAVESRS